MDQYRDEIRGREVRDTNATAPQAIDAMLGTTLDNLRQIRSSLGIIASRINQRPMAMQAGGEQKPKEPSLFDLAGEAADLSKSCANLAADVEGMLFQSARPVMTARVG